MSRKRELGLAIGGSLMLPLLWAASLATAQAAAPAARAPRTCNSTVTRTGPAGNTYTRRSSLSTNGQGGFSANSTWTGPNGNTIATRQQSGNYDAATGTYTSSGTFTGPRGCQSTFNRSVQRAGAAPPRTATPAPALPAGN